MKSKKNVFIQISSDFKPKAWNKRTEHTLCMIKPYAQLVKGGGHASILLTFLCNFTILATQRGGAMAQCPPLNTALAVGLFQCSLLKMVQCLYFHIFILNTIVSSALLKLRLCKNLYSKSFLNGEICVPFSRNQFVVALHYVQFLVAEFVFAL